MEVESEGEWVSLLFASERERLRVRVSGKLRVFRIFS